MVRSGSVSGASSASAVQVAKVGQGKKIHVTDPVQKELQALNSRLEWLEQLMDEQARSKNL